MRGEKLGGRCRVVAAFEGRRWCREEKGRKCIEVICFGCVCFVAFGMGWEAMALPSTFQMRALHCALMDGKYKLAKSGLRACVRNV